MKSFDEIYPYIANWVKDGHIEVGYFHYDGVFLRAIDTGGVIWKSDKVYNNPDDAFAELEAGIAAWCKENASE